MRSWLYQQRKKSRAGALTQEAAQRLSAIDPLWYDEQASLLSARTRGFFRLTDASWDEVKLALPGRGGDMWENSDHRVVAEAILWKLGTGARWDDLALAAGSPVTVASWYYEWEKSGLRQEISRRAKVNGRHL